MKRRDYRKEKSRQDVEDGFKKKCVGCGMWAIVDGYGFCDNCAEEEMEGEDAYQGN